MIFKRIARKNRVRYYVSAQITYDHSCIFLFNGNVGKGCNIFQYGCIEQETNRVFSLHVTQQKREGTLEL